MAASQAITHDPGFFLPKPPVPPPPLTGPGGETVLQGDATDAPFLLTGRKARATGTERGGIQEIRLHSSPPLLNLRADLGSGLRVSVAPGSIRRELEGPAGAVVERLLVFRELPAAIIQWTRAASGEMPLDLHLRFELGPFASSAGPPLRYRGEGAVLRVASGERGPGIVSFLHPAPEGWELQGVEGPGGLRVLVRATVRCNGGGPITLGVAADSTPSHEGDASLSPFRFLPAQERLWAGSGRGDPDEPLLVDASDPEVGAGLDWAKTRMDAADPDSGLDPPRSTLPAGAAEVGTRALHRSEPPEEHSLWAGIGALAAGRFSHATHVLATALESRPWEGKGEESQVVPLALLLAGESLRWSGSPELLRSQGEALHQAAVWCRDRTRDSGRAGTRALADAALLALADAHETVGDRLRAGEVRAWARAAGPAPPSPPGLELLEALLGDNRLPPDWPSRLPERGTTVEAALLAWALFRRGHAREGWLLWRELLEKGMEPPRGMWALDAESLARGIPDHPPTAALLVAGFVFGLLGARGDAWFGRLRLRPQLPAHWSSLTVRNLCLGDARVAMEYARRGEEHVFRITQTGGRVPLNLVFEPLFVGVFPEVLLNGASVEVGRFELGERQGVRFQLPLHQEQTVVLSGGR